MDNNEINYDLSFSDQTILETEGVFDEVKKLMEEDLHKDAKWMIKSELTIESVMGFCRMILNFYDTKDIYVAEYQTSSGDVFYNSDIRCLSVWAQDNGWNVPKPSSDLIRSDVEFWKHFWESRLIDSEYLDEKYGERKILYSDYNMGEDEEDVNLT